MQRKKRRKRRERGLSHRRENDEVEAKAEVVAETGRKGGVEADRAVANDRGGGGHEAEAEIVDQEADALSHAGSLDPDHDPGKEAGVPDRDLNGHDQEQEDQGPGTAQEDDLATEVGTDEAGTDLAKNDLVKTEVAELGTDPAGTEVGTSLAHAIDLLIGPKKGALTLKMLGRPLMTPLLMAKRMVT